MPKFLTYQRPAPVNRSKGGKGGKPGTAYGKPGKQLPKPAPEARNRVLDIKLPGIKTPPKV